MVAGRGAVVTGDARVTTSGTQLPYISKYILYTIETTIQIVICCLFSRSLVIINHLIPHNKEALRLYQVLSIFLLHK
jgi:hypothetical protein